MWLKNEYPIKIGCCIISYGDTAAMIFLCSIVIAFKYPYGISYAVVTAAKNLACFNTFKLLAGYCPAALSECGKDISCFRSAFAGIHQVIRHDSADKCAAVSFKTAHSGAEAGAEGAECAFIKSELIRIAQKYGLAAIAAAVLKKYSIIFSVHFTSPLRHTAYLYKNGIITRDNLNRFKQIPIIHSIFPGDADCFDALSVCPPF